MHPAPAILGIYLTMDVVAEPANPSIFGTMALIGFALEILKKHEIWLSLGLAVWRKKLMAMRAGPLFPMIKN
jgi:hypothetical protein